MKAARFTEPRSKNVFEAALSGAGLSTPDVRGQFLIVPQGNTAYVSARRSRQARGLNRNRRTAFPASLQGGSGSL